MGINILFRVVGYDFHHIRKKYDVPSMWGNVRPRWRLLQQHLETKGPGWYSLAEREERLFNNRSNQPGDDMKERTNFGLITVPMLGAPGVLHRTNCGSFVNQLLPWSFLVSKECLLACMPRFERKNKLYRCSLLVVSKMYQIAGKKKRKQVDDGSAIA